MGKADSRPVFWNSLLQKFIKEYIITRNGGNVREFGLRSVYSLSTPFSLQLYRDAMECMDLLSQRLGSNKFFFGDSPSSLDAFVFGYLVPILKMKLPNGRLQQHLKSLDNLGHFCSNILGLYFPSEGRGGFSRKVSSQPEGGDADNEPGKRRKQLLSVLVALAPFGTPFTGLGAFNTPQGAQTTVPQASGHSPPTRKRRRMRAEDGEEETARNQTISCLYS
ncbi:hypothetical protein J4Q44_G00386320 [Coregonus suidteri]|uniref:Metaxin glutathione S-transferase domain-containing protein n=1 Tax=Coregonus suidteri TaxID=861788 RepID=A0AAN8KLE7_9TELE